MLTNLLTDDRLELEREDRDMRNMSYALNNIVPITLFNRGQAGKIFGEVKNGSPKIVIKNNEPEAVIISPDEYNELIERIEDAELLALAIERETQDDGTRYSQKEVMEELGITQEEIDAMEDVEIG